MTNNNQDNLEQRQFPRFEFDASKSPVLIVENREFRIEDISQGGVKFLKGKAVDFPDVIYGKVVFEDGGSVDIEGNIAWEHEDVVGLSFEELIPKNVLEKNQQVAFLQTKISIPKLTTPVEHEVSSGYTLQKLLNIGIPSERLEEWMKNGYIESSIPKAEQKGGKKLFSRFDLYAVKLFEYLLNCGFSAEEASLRIKVVILAEKKPGRYLYENPFLAFSRKVSFDSVPDAMKNIMLTWLSDKEKLDNAEKEKARIYLRNFIPAVVPVTGDKIVLSSTLFSECNDILIVNFKKIRDEVDAVLDEA